MSSILVKESLSKQALGVYIDNIVRVAKEENDGLKKFQHLQIQLSKVLLYHYDSIIEELPVTGFVDGGDDFFYYELTANYQTNMETANHFCCSSAGMPIWPRNFLAARSRAELYFDEGGKLLLKLCLADDWFLTCFLSGYLGTKEDVQHIVDNRLHRNYFTGLAFLGGINQVAPLFGAVLRPWRLSIRKKNVAAFGIC
jgi:hypothetical protein